MPEENGIDVVLAEVDQKMDLLRSCFRDHEKARECMRRLDVSAIYHDFALEGTVLSFPELNSSIDDEIISDITLIPAYEDVRNHKRALAFVRQEAAKRTAAIDIEYFRQLHHILSTEVCERPGKAPPKPQAGQYRKDMPLHRLYFHEISQPDKIAYHVRKFAQWLVEDEARKLHPVKRAAFAHHRMISIFPWPRHSGKIARLVMTAVFLQADYLPAVVHAVDRQRYYEILRQPPIGLADLVAESATTTLDSALRFFGHNIKAS